MGRVHEIRNDLQHDGGWIVPSEADAEVGRQGAVAVFDALAGDHASAQFRPKPDLELRPSGVSLLRRDYLPNPLDQSAADRRRIAPAAFALAQQQDPDHEGIHFTRLVQLLADAQPALSVSSVSMQSALNNAHDLFERVAPGAYAWRPTPGRDISEGVTGRALADVAYAWCRLNDPDGSGSHYNRNIKRGLEAWGVRIKGADVGKTIRDALRADGRFVGERGFFRLTERPKE